MRADFHAHDAARGINYGFRETALCNIQTRQCLHTVAFYCGDFIVSHTMPHASAEDDCERTFHRCTALLTKVIVEDYDKEFSAAMRGKRR